MLSYGILIKHNFFPTQNELICVSVKFGWVLLVWSSVNELWISFATDKDVGLVELCLTTYFICVESFLAP